MRFFCAPDKNVQFKSSGLECCTTFEVSYHHPVKGTCRHNELKQTIDSKNTIDFQMFYAESSSSFLLFNTNILLLFLRRLLLLDTMLSRHLKCVKLPFHFVKISWARDMKDREQIFSKHYFRCSNILLMMDSCS